MPYKWVPPRVAARSRENLIYHTYRRGEEESSWYFCTDPAQAEEGMEEQLDLRDQKIWKLLTNLEPPMPEELKIALCLRYLAETPEEIIW